MPSVIKGEKRSHYLSRAIPEMIREGLSQKAAVGKAEGMFNSKWTAKKKKKKIIKTPKSEMVKEHRHLVKVLKNPNKTKLSREASKQSQELKEYLKW